MGKDITPIVHGSVMTRMICGNDRYAPISLPQTIAVLPPVGPPVQFEKTEVARAQRDANATREWRPDRTPTNPSGSSLSLCAG